LRLLSFPWIVGDRVNQLLDLIHAVTVSPWMITKVNGALRHPPWVVFDRSVALRASPWRIVKLSTMLMTIRV